MSHSNRLWVRFKSDTSVTRPGFMAHWDGTQTGEVQIYVMPVFTISAFSLSSLILSKSLTLWAIINFHNIL